MSLDIRVLTDALADLDKPQSSSMRFQLACPNCGNFIWTSEDTIGNQINCRNCDAVVTVQAPPPPNPQGTELAISAAGSERYRSPYWIVEPLNLSPASSLVEMFQAFHSGDQEAEALRQLRNVTQRFAHDLLCYPHWHDGDIKHGSE